MKLVTAAQMSAIELSSVDAGVSLDELMENAGLAVAEAVRSGFGDHSELYGKRILILIGPGNNGADGFVAGRHLANWGASVTAVLCAERRSPDPKRHSAGTAGVTTIDGLLSEGVELLEKLLETADLVVDAILGTGRSRPIADPLSSLLFTVLQAAVPVIALDLPTGLNSDSGEFDLAGLPADKTLSLGYPKLGSAISGDPSLTGEISVLDIGIPTGLDSQVTTELLSHDLAATFLPERPTDGHKGTFGSVLLVGGSQDYVGAVAMATDAATRSGAGLTFVAIPEPVHRQIAGGIPEAMYRSLPLESNCDIDPSRSAEIVLNLVERSTAVVIGPGLGNSSSTTEFLSIVLAQTNSDIPLVLDADALNILSGSHRWWDRLENPGVLTPHPGEMSRLMRISTGDVQADRVSVAQEAAKRFGKVIVLKGAATLIASPDGRLAVSPWVNSGLAKGGSGDVLAGLLGGLLAQLPTELFEMAALAVFTHGYAADIARQEFGETGMRATDVTRQLGAFSRDFS